VTARPVPAGTGNAHLAALRNAQRQHAGQAARDVRLRSETGL